MPAVVRNRLRRWTVRVSALATTAQTILELANEPGAELSVELIGQARMRRLNRQFRGIDRSTDVLAFSLRESPGPPTPLLGDVVIAVPVAEKQAADLGHSLDEELLHLLIHGILHLMGYDHERGEREARRMRRKEQAVRRAIGPLPTLIRMKRKTRHGLV